MAIRARSDNLSLDHPAAEADVPAVAPVVDFSELWAHREALRQACYRMVGNAATAEDLVQDTFLRALRSSAHLERRPSVAPWLATVARRRSIDELRARRRMTVVESPPEPAPGLSDDPVHQVINQELVERLRAALGELTERERQLLLRQVSHGVSLAELAADESTSVASVRSVLARARQKLRTSLERSGALGALPLPRFLLPLRDRLQRWAGRVEGALPFVTGAGLKFADTVAAVVVAVAMVVGAVTVPTPPGKDAGLALPATSTAATNPNDGHAGHDTTSRGRNTQSTTRSNGTAVPSPLPPMPGIPLPQDSADQPEQTEIEHITTTSDPDIVFASGKTRRSADHAIYRTTDGGRSWKRLQAQNYDGGRLLIPPAYPADPTIYAVGARSLLRSSDDGGRFEPVAPVTPAVTSAGGAVMSPNYSNGDPRIFIPGSPFLEYRADTGVTQPLSATAASPDLGDVVFADTDLAPGTMLLGGSTVDGTEVRKPAIYRCTPNMCARQKVFATSFGAPSLYVSKTTPGSVFAWRGAMEHSTDGGVTFAPMTTPHLMVETVADGPDGTLLVGGLPISTTATSGLYSSADGGATWRPLGTDTALAKGARRVSALGSRLLAALYGGGVLCSVDGGDTWAARCPTPARHAA